MKCWISKREIFVKYEYLHLTGRLQTCDFKHTSSNFPCRLIPSNYQQFAWPAKMLSLNHNKACLPITKTRYRIISKNEIVLQSKNLPHNFSDVFLNILSFLLRFRVWLVLRQYLLISRRYFYLKLQWCWVFRFTNWLSRHLWYPDPVYSRNTQKLQNSFSFHDELCCDYIHL